MRSVEAADHRPRVAPVLSRRRVLRGGLIAGGAAFLAACGSGAPPLPTAAPTEAGITAPAAAVPTAATPATATASVRPQTAMPTGPGASFTGTDLKIMSPSGYFDPCFALGTANWTAATGGTATPVATDFAEYPVKMAGMIATQDPSFDILYLTAVYGYALRFGPRLFLPVGRDVVDTSDFLEDSIEGLTSADGVLRALPLYDNTNVWGWNRQAFATIGEDPDNPPDTYEALFALAPKFKARGIIPCVQPWLATQTTSFAQLYWTQIYNSTGHPMFSDDRTQVLFDGDAGLLTFETIEQGIATGWWDSAYMNLANDNDAYTLFLHGNVATVIEGSFPVSTGPMAQFGSNHGVRQFPGIRPGTTGSVGGPGGCGVNRFSKSVDASWDWMRAQFGADIARQAALSSQHYPVARKSVMADPAVVRAIPLLAAYARQYEGVTNPWPTPYDTQSVFNDVIAKMVTGDYTAKQAQAAAVKGCQDAIVTYLSS
jgi:ABC-type glycerol-3-phosphate transport system substrate-binding protein